MDTDSFIAFKKIANLITFSGKNALGKRHLVTLTTDEILNQLNYKKLSHRIAKSLEMLGFYENMIYKSFKNTLIV